MIRAFMEADCLRLTLSSSEDRNALSLEDARCISKSLKEYAPGSLLLDSEGPIFCSGGQLRDYAALKTREEGVQRNSEIRKILGGLANLSFPKAVVVAGSCYGGGVELLSCFDFVAATPESLFGLWQRRNGLSFGWGGRRRLDQKIGPAATTEWFLSAGTKSAYEVRDLGLLQRVGTLEDIRRATASWLVRSQGFRSQSAELHRQLEIPESEAFRRLWWNPDHIKSLSRYRPMNKSSD